MNALFSISNQFGNAVTEVTALGNGLINDTYLVSTPSSSFVLQRINRAVFPAPEQIMANLTTLNQHVTQKNAALVMLQIPKALKTIDNNALYQDQNGDYWRALSFIADTESIETISTISEAEQSGFALGHFHRLLSDLNPLLLHDTLPGFHITPQYLKHYQQILRQPAKPEESYCAEFICRFQHIADDLEAAKQQGLLSLRVIHGDPKLNNFLFNRCSRKVVSIIDLDTVKPGLIHYDIGDCLRSCCHAAGPAGFNLDICAAWLKSYLAEAGAFFTEYDYQYLYPAIRLIPFELGIRFYSDYLEGNRYFKVTESEQNLQRAIGQFRLCESIMVLEEPIKSLISKLQTHN
ncbi:phosphotransferase enzyme family protein [Candidatus Methylobacter oryzae]|uniref:Aminoglycoside phosphotransferase family protein n=1 Tax=Candidatus Methylobacter oryzae TaxID=2497749 RepID=A0ABY3CBN0_9GAMM|nr:aminoglycoside phosphotransferase family protein [Candidatus Methylobacter oryzae]TRW96989.1 aminoglycoside phosphotransferase family protein [Candidatus Methylobacter oryzae]